MKGSLFIHVVIIIVSVLVAGFLGKSLYEEQKTISPTRGQLTALPVGGFHKFLSDVKWMLFVNHLGTLTTVDDKNVDDVTSRLENLIAYDPNLPKIYQEGVSMIAIANPDKTVEILEKACENPNLKNNSQIPFYAGFVLVQHMKNPNYERAIPFFKKAIERSGGSDHGNTYYTSYYYRAKAKVLAQKDGKMDDRLALLTVLFDEWKGSAASDRMDAPSSEFNSQDLKERLLTAVRNAKNPSEDYTPTPEALKLAQEITTAVFSDAHLCHNCTSAYGPGEAFCSNCGTEVKVYGVCPYCQKIMKPGAKFCITTGKAYAPAPKK